MVEYEFLDLPSCQRCEVNLTILLIVVWHYLVHIYNIMGQLCQFFSYISVCFFMLWYLFSSVLGFYTRYSFSSFLFVSLLFISFVFCFFVFPFEWIVVNEIYIYHICVFNFPFLTVVPGFFFFKIWYVKCSLSKCQSSTEILICTWMVCWVVVVKDM